MCPSGMASPPIFLCLATLDLSIHEILVDCDFPLSMNFLCYKFWKKVDEVLLVPFLIFLYATITIIRWLKSICFFVVFQAEKALADGLKIHQIQMLHCFGS